jgi:hypothetical protein
MKRTRYVLVALMAVLCMTFLVSKSAAWSWYTVEVGITNPQDGDRFVTHDLIRIRWYAIIEGQIPPPGTIHYMIELNGQRLTYDYYDDFVNLGSGYFKAFGSFDYRVPGNGYSKIPNSILQVFSGNDDCSDCYSILAPSVTIGIKTWYDPLPIPKEESRTTIGGPNIKSDFLDEPYPNPFNPSTTVKFELKEASTVSLQIFNVNGQLVETLRNNEFLPAGEYRDSWNGQDSGGNKAPSGVYFLKLTTGNGYSETRKMVLVQ